MKTARIEGDGLSPDRADQANLADRSMTEELFFAGIAEMGRDIVHGAVFAEQALASGAFDHSLEYLARVRIAVDELESVVRKLRGETPPWERTPLIVTPDGRAL